MAMACVLLLGNLAASFWVDTAALPINYHARKREDMLVAPFAAGLCAVGLLAAGARCSTGSRTLLRIQHICQHTQSHVRRFAGNALPHSCSSVLWHWFGAVSLPTDAGHSCVMERRYMY